jgi:hypothetical protein
MAKKRVASQELAVIGETALDPPTRQVLAEALRRGAEAADVAEDAIVGFGRWLLVHVFADDAAAALDARSENPVWRELVRRAGGPTLRLGQRALYVALHVAARDKRIGDEAWRGLDVSRKELLLPLGDEAAMRKAAQHVTAMKLSARATRDYVAALRAQKGRGPRARVTGERVVTRVQRFNKLAGDEASQRKSLAALRDLDDAKRRSAEAELRRLRDWAAALLRGLREG